MVKLVFVAFLLTLRAQTMSGCQVSLVSIVFEHRDVYFNIYYWFRVVFIHLVPCSALVVLTMLLVNAMRRAQHRRQLLLKQNRRSESRRLAESNWTTLMLVAVVGVFLVVELPLAVLFIMLIFDKTFDFALVDDSSYELATLFTNMVIVLSYPFNFVIYCTMSRQFRATFRGMFCRGSGAVEMAAAAATVDAMAQPGRTPEHTNYVTLADNGPKQAEPHEERQLLTVETHL